MFPHIQIFLRQTLRGKARLALNMILLCSATAFFVLSMNLYYNSTQNLEHVENSYTTIATAEFYGYVNAAGDLVSPGDESCVGWHWLSVDDYDLSPLLALDSVKSIDLRTRVGAYIPGHVGVFDIGKNSLLMDPDWVSLFSTNDVIRFTLDAEEPMVISLQETDFQYLPFPIRILEQSNPLLSYPDKLTLCIPKQIADLLAMHSDDIRRLNRSDRTDQIVLYPGVEYVIACFSGQYWERDEETGRYIWKFDQGYYSGGNVAVFYGPALSIYGFNYYDDFLVYDEYYLGRDVVRDGLFRNGPFAIQRYEDVKDDAEWAAYTQSGMYEASSFTVTLTDEISRIPAWYQGAMYLNEGRMITQEEYQTGAKVCMISAEMAARQGWNVGDTLDMHLFAYEAFYDKAPLSLPAWFILNYHLENPPYLEGCGGFFEEDTYTIVGIFGQREFAEFGETGEAVYYNPYNAIYVPANTAPNAPAGPIQPSLLTIHLKNGSVAAFRQAVEKMGLTEFRTGEYQIKFSYFDQGYSKIKPGLDEMNRNAVLLLCLSTLLLVATIVILAFLFSQHHRHSASILRMLGGSKKQAFTAILTCAAAVVLVGSLLGAAIGGLLTQSVGQGMMDAAASARVAMSTGANPMVTALSGLGCVALFLVLTAIFTGGYVGEEPRALLPQSKA